MSKFFTNHKSFISLGLLLLLLASCGSLRTMPETWSVVKLLSSSESIQPVDEIVTVRNCGSIEVKSTSCSAGTQNNLTFTGGFSVGSQYFQINPQVSTELGIGRDSGQSLALQSPPGNYIYQYLIHKVYRVITGEAQLHSSNGDEQKTSYVFNASCDISIVKQDKLSCGSEEISAPQSESTPVPPLPRWEQEAAKVPSSGTQLKWELEAGQVLFLSGGQIRVNGSYCGGDASQICVLIFQATTSQGVVVDSLIPENNWYGITSTLTPDEALNDKVSQFWSKPNCINGCRKATVLFFTDGNLVNKITLMP